jgi:hypothetical protein
MSALVRQKPQIIAAGLYGLLALMVTGIWIIFLFVGNPKGVSAADNLAYAFLSSATSSRWFFVLLAVLVLTSIALCTGYASRVARSKRRSLALLGVSAGQGVAASVLLPWPQAGLFVLPLYWCYICWRQT